MTATYILSYVNFPTGEHYYDKEFTSVSELEAFVAEQHPHATSYQIVVVTRAASKAEA